ncbi:MAG TPA: PQQ-dependent sugar dehydrogenase [Candidatus Paceibacterota bacterium]
MNKIFFLIVGTLVLVLVAWGGFTYWGQIRGLGPAILPPVDDIEDIIDGSTSSPQENLIEFPLVLPEGFSISIFAKDLPGARVMAFDGLGNMWVSQTSEGKITLLEVRDGKVQSQNAVFQNLQRPHGLAFHPQQSSLLYFAEEDGVSRVPVYSEAKPEKLFDLPRGGNHFTRTLMFAPDGRLLTSVGSTCNACEESDWRRAAVLVSNEDGEDLKVFAKGLRNAVFMATHFVTGEIWATEMGRDFLGDDLPPDEINILKEDGDYGWPYCYGKNVSDTAYAQNSGCDNFIPSHIDLQAHSAPLGLAFIPEDPSTSSGQAAWPEEYWYNLLVAYHGSWNRSEPTGYKVVRFKLDAHGNYEGMDSTGSPQGEDFISGWLDGDRALGRPVDILVQPGGVMYISDDKAGVIYKVMVH